MLTTLCPAELPIRPKSCTGASVTISISPDSKAATLVAALAIGSNSIEVRLCSTSPHHFLFF